MKNSINNAFKIAQKENRPALISYTVCGDNTKEKSLKILNSISKDLDIAEGEYLTIVQLPMVKIFKIALTGPYKMVFD